MKRSALQICVTLIGVVCLLTILSAQSPQLLNYQGRLTNNDGTPASGKKFVVFTIYPDSVKNTPVLWFEARNIEVTHGLFNVLLGSKTAFDTLFASPGPRYLGITVEGDREMTPRFRLASVPFSLNARRTATHQKVAFSAYVATSDLNNDRDPLPMKVVSNNIGGYYDPTTSKFTAPVKGIYLFTMTGLSRVITTLPLDWHLKINDQYANSSGVGMPDPYQASQAAWIRWESSNFTSSRTVILALKKGDKVYIEQKGTGFCDNFSSGFEGVLLYADEE